MEERTFCELGFNTFNDRTRIIRIPEPCVDTNAEIIGAAAELIINANPFDETVGPLRDLRHADIVTISRVVLF